MFADFHGQEAMDYYLEDMEGLDDDDYADMEEQMLGQFGFFHGTHTPAPNSLAENSGPRWVYTGIKNQKETRAACKEVRMSYDLRDIIKLLTFPVRYQPRQVHRGYY